MAPGEKAKPLLPTKCTFLLEAPQAPPPPAPVCASALSQVSKVWHQQMAMKGEKDMVPGPSWRSEAGSGSSLCISCLQPGKILPFPCDPAEFWGPKGRHGTGELGE